MTWLFAILVVLALGAIAVVASGRGGAMPEAYDDRPDLDVPAGRIDGTALRRVRFSVALRGYRMSEVDALLDRLAHQLDQRADERPDERPAERPVERAEPREDPAHGPDRNTQER